VLSVYITVVTCDLGDAWAGRGSENINVVLRL